MVRIPDFHCVAQVQSLVGELRSSKPRGAAKKQNKTNNKKKQKCTVFAEEIMTTTQLAIKTMFSGPTAYPGEDLAAPGSSSYPLPRTGGGFGECT